MNQLETMKAAFMDELEKIAGSSKKAETEKERAHRYGKKGALIGSGIHAGTGLAALAAMRAFGGKGAIKDFMGHMPGGAKGYAAATALSNLESGAAGYGLGRLVHRIKHGPATDKKVKTSGSLQGHVRSGRRPISAMKLLEKESDQDKVSDIIKVSKVGKSGLPSKTLALLGAGAGGYHLLRQAEQDRRTGRQFRIQQNPF